MSKNPLGSLVPPRRQTPGCYAHIFNCPAASSDAVRASVAPGGAERTFIPSTWGSAGNAKYER